MYVFRTKNKGKITGIVAKEFLVVQGNGTSTIAELLNKNPRYALQLNVLKKEYGKQLDEILPKEGKRNLVPYGNHARGAKFIDASDKISPQLSQVIDQICVQVVPPSQEICTQILGLLLALSARASSRTWIPCTTAVGGRLKL